MWDTIQKLEYRVRANIEGAQQELNMRLTDRMELPLLGLNGEKLYLTGLAALRKKAMELDALYEQLPAHRGVKDTILLDAWSSATIEGARTTVQRVRDHFENPKTKDDRMVVNTIMGSNYAYNRTLESICDDMDPRAFCRVNKQYVVAREHITSIVVWSNSRLLVSMDTETPEPVFLSKNRAAEFKKWITG